VVQAQLENFDGTVARLAAARCTAARELTVQILALEKEIHRPGRTPHPDPAAGARMRRPDRGEDPR
jgi:hypothetical protein